MDDKILLAIIAGGSALVGGVVTSILSPLVKHYLEQNVAKETRKREQIKLWRDMVAAVANECEESRQAGQLLTKHPDFQSLEPLLQDDAKQAVHGRNFTVSSGNSLGSVLETVKKEISRIECEWKLR